MGNYKLDDLSLIDEETIGGLYPKKMEHKRFDSVKNIFTSSEEVFLRGIFDLLNRGIKIKNCGIEYDKNDPSVRICHLDIDYLSFNMDNKYVAGALINSFKAARTIRNANIILSIIVPCKIDDTIGEVSRRILEMTSKFSHQNRITKESSSKQM